MTAAHTAAPATAAPEPAAPEPAAPTTAMGLGWPLAGGVPSGGLGWPGQPAEHEEEPT